VRIHALLIITVLLLTTHPAQADEASSLYHQAMAYKKQHKYNDAIVKLKAAIVARDDYAAAHYSLGILYRKQKKNDKAIKHLERATKLEGQSGKIFYSLGLAYYAAGQKKKALTALDKAAAMEPNNDQLVASLGTLLIRFDPERALRHLHHAVKLKPQDGGHLHQLGLAYRRAAGRAFRQRKKAKGDKYMAQAEKYLVQATAFLDKNAKLHFDLGVLYRRLERTKKAVHHYERALELNPKLAAAWWDLGHMYANDKRNDDAVKAYQKYIDLKGGSKDASIARKRLKELKKRK